MRTRCYRMPMNFCIRNIRAVAIRAMHGLSRNRATFIEFINMFPSLLVNSISDNDLNERQLSASLAPALYVRNVGDFGISKFWLI